ncbi:hypothetical protein [Roseobacter sp.]|uniref:hypothetical protein n=1 Tax=Roseobacter sp. TaxID=1907202 RepID=UPI0029671D8A|nr:hypothetical protein [Roseobacter sp.]MDW3181747.1 hypothetical protein [Roseobacter sp.]
MSHQGNENDHRRQFKKEYEKWKNRCLWAAVIALLGSGLAVLNGYLNQYIYCAIFVIVIYLLNMRMEDFCERKASIDVSQSE